MPLLTFPQWGGSSNGTVSADAAYHLLLAIWSDNWVTGSVSVSLSLSLSFSESEDHDGGHGHHHHHKGWGWFDHGHYRIADDEYWTARERMLRRHMPAEHHEHEKPVTEEVKALETKRVRLLQEAAEITDLDMLADLVSALDKLSAQILDIQLQSDDEALAVLLLC